MIEGWMVNVATLSIAMVASYAIIKYKVEAAFKDIGALRKNIKEHNLYEHDNINNKTNACFKKLDEISNSVIVLERDTAYHLDMKQAEVKFVTKEELSLNMNNIDSELNYLNKNGDIILGKLEDLTKALSQYMISELNDKDN